MANDSSFAITYFAEERGILADIIVILSWTGQLILSSDGDLQICVLFGIRISEWSSLGHSVHIICVPDPQGSLNAKILVLFLYQLLPLISK